MTARHIPRPPPCGGETAEGRTRWRNDLFGYWQICDARVCKRRRGCAGDAQACFSRYWWLTPEALKVEYRALVRAVSNGLSGQDALRAAKAEVDRSAEHIARVDAEVTEKIRRQDAAVAAAAAPSSHPPLEGEGRPA